MFLEGYARNRGERVCEWGRDGGGEGDLADLVLYVLKDEVFFWDLVVIYLHEVFLIFDQDGLLLGLSPLDLT